MSYLSMHDLAGLSGLSSDQARPAGSSVRPSCLDCVRKHLAQAAVLLQEARQGYPDHRWLAVGHLAEASDECLDRFPEFANKIRAHRLRVMSGAGYSPPILDLIREATALNGGA